MGFRVTGQRYTVKVGYCPDTVTVCNRATIKVLLYVCYEYYPTVTEWGSVPKVKAPSLPVRTPAAQHQRLIDMWAMAVPRAPASPILYSV